MKPKKTAEELVQMLHDEKGIQFHLISEEQAVDCFSQRTIICAQHLIEKITPNILLAQMQENTSILSLHI